jgi:hypothetical protein
MTDLEDMNLDQLGRRHRKLEDDLKAVREALAPAIRAERAAGASYADLLNRSGYRSIETIRQITKPDQRDAANSHRRKKPADAAD